MQQCYPAFDSPEELLLNLKERTRPINVGPATPTRLLEQAHGLVILLAETIRYAKDPEKYVPAFDAALARYQRRAVLIATK